jgi:hypothetical protein
MLLLFSQFDLSNSLMSNYCVVLASTNKEKTEYVLDQISEVKSTVPEFYVINIFWNLMEVSFIGKLYIQPFMMLT